MIALLMAMSLFAGDHKLVGTWHYVAYRYADNTLPVQSGVDLRFRFDDSGEAALRWTYGDENEFCQRSAVFNTNVTGVIYQHVTSVDPLNHSSCVKDPDMQLGRETYTKYNFEAEHLLMELSLSGEPFTYIFERILTKP